ncbi:PH domain-containing protein [Shewanella submarina]|uniref:PH domain-containing protein n=1 Tax=Shewanella submarina TaxID=2016376 RepID=A0ABV7GLQ8_9GAMM|nr:PH domain-containing protein [Shewanella submarina]MCL1036082.1 PH domain-containing protein [Shewanella submarina]
MSELKSWSRLSPWAIINYVFKSAIELLSNGFAVIPFVVTGWKAGFDSPWIPVAIAAGLLLILGYALIQWLKFRYRLSDDKLNVRSGALFTKRQELPLDKIQNVRLEQPFYYRPFGLCTLVVESAGSKKDEVELAAIAREQAQQMKQHLLRLGKGDSQEISISTDLSLDKGHEGELLVIRDAKALCLFGLYSNNLIWAAAILGPLSGTLEWSVWVDMVQHNALIEGFNHQGLILQILLATVLLLVLAVLITGINVLATILKYYPFRLTRTASTMQRSGGVISHQQDGLPIRRVQILEASQPFIARLLGLWTVIFRQVQGQEVEKVVDKSLLTPSLKPFEVNQLISRTFPFSDADNKLPSRYLPIHSDWLWRRLPLPFIIPLLNSFSLGANPFTLTLWLGATLASVVIWLRYRKWGYRLGKEVVWQHTGVIGRNWKRIPLGKVQHVCIRQTPGQRRKHLANLQLGLASGTVSLPSIPLRHARLIAEKVLKHTRTDHSNWI